MHINEGNQLIAEFMGADYLSPEPGVKSYYFPDGKAFPNGNSYEYSDKLLYHNDYTWLMPVFFEVERHGCIVEITSALMTTCSIIVLGNKGENATRICFTNDGADPHTKPIWEAIVEFLRLRDEKD